MEFNYTAKEFKRFVLLVYKAIDIHFLNISFLLVLWLFCFYFTSSFRCRSPCWFYRKGNLQRQNGTIMRASFTTCQLLFNQSRTSLLFHHSYKHKNAKLTHTNGPPPHCLASMHYIIRRIHAHTLSHDRTHARAGKHTQTKIVNECVYTSRLPNPTRITAI